MSSIKKVRMSDGDIMEVEVVTDNYKYKGWACTLDKVGEWK